MECFVVCFVRNLYPITLTAVIALPGFLTALLVAVSTNVDISDDESGMAKDILFKPRVEATVAETDATKLDISRSKIQRESQKLHPRDMYVVDISCFHCTLRLKT